MGNRDFIPTALSPTCRLCEEEWPKQRISSPNPPVVRLSLESMRISTQTERTLQANLVLECIYTAVHLQLFFPIVPSVKREIMDNDTMDSTRVHDIWNEGFEDQLVHMLYEDTLMGRLRGGRITNGDNVRLAEQLFAVGHKKFNSEQVKGKIARLKRKQREFTDLMKQTGLGWDSERKAPVASEEHWANAIRVRPSWKNFKTWGCPRYEQLCAIFNCAVATGTMQHASTDPTPDSDDERFLDEEMLNHGRLVTDNDGGPSSCIPR
ncbi:hypothetical protein I3760_10G117100 [Carya illinoinensis]|nr:hypothetical protein I3760_10G117100 [Carya illinoinensis]